MVLNISKTFMVLGYFQTVLTEKLKAIDSFTKLPVRLVHETSAGNCGRL